jgi:hypothetical protein
LQRFCQHLQNKCAGTSEPAGEEFVNDRQYLYATIIVAGRKSPKSLYNPKIPTREGDASAYDQNDATGFIRLNALRLKLRAAVKSAPRGTKNLGQSVATIWEG